MKKITFAILLALLTSAVFAQNDSDGKKQNDEINPAPDLNLINTSSGFINNFTANASLKFGKF